MKAGAKSLTVAGEAAATIVQPDFIGLRLTIVSVQTVAYEGIQVAIPVQVAQSNPPTIAVTQALAAVGEETTARAHSLGGG
ncbi:MAG: hypothetical protein V9G20_08815 [Candidatus Promineifilaceae bacterium]